MIYQASFEIFVGMVDFRYRRLFGSSLVEDFGSAAYFRLKQLWEAQATLEQTVDALIDWRESQRRQIV